MTFFLQVDEELDELISRIKLQEGNTELWKRCFLGEGINGDHVKQTEPENLELQDTLDDADASDEADASDDADVMEDIAKEVEDEEVDEEEEEVQQTENQVGDRVKNKEVEAAKPPQMIGVQLLKDSDETTATSSKSKKKKFRRVVQV